MNQSPDFPINSDARNMNQNPNFPMDHNAGNMNLNLNPEENQEVDELDLSLYVGIRPSPPPQQRLLMVERPLPQLPLAQPESEQQQYYQQRSMHQPPPVVGPPPQAPQQNHIVPLVPLRSRRRPRTETNIIPPPFPWATNMRASIHSLEELRTRQIFTISDQVRCKKCDRQFEMEYNLQEKFDELISYITANGDDMRDRAHTKWTDPIFPSCRFCGQDNCVKPIISEKKRSINWLFLLLGQMLGCLTLKQLKYFGKHRDFHRSGAKNRVLYAIYMDLVTQLKGNPS